MFLIFSYLLVTKDKHSNDYVPFLPDFLTIYNQLIYEQLIDDN